MRSEIIRAVLDHSHEGILSVDLENKINLINPVAKQILKYSHLHDGRRKIEEICPQLDMSEILNQGIDILNQIYQRFTRSKCYAIKFQLKIEAK